MINLRELRRPECVAFSKGTFKDKLKVFPSIWVMGNLGGLSFWFLKATRRIKIEGYHKTKFKANDKGLLLFSNHPSPAEPLLLAGLFYPRYLFSFKTIPFALPAGEHYDRWWYAPFRRLSIRIDRDNPRQGPIVTKKLEKVLSEGKVLVMHPERERVFEEGDDDSIFSTTGRRMKKFRTGSRRLFSSNECQVLPIWIDGGEKMFPNKPAKPSKLFLQWPRPWRKVTIKVGEPLDLSGISKAEILEYLENVLLELADKEMARNPA